MCPFSSFLGLVVAVFVAILHASKPPGQKVSSTHITRFSISDSLIHGRLLDGIVPSHDGRDIPERLDSSPRSPHAGLVLSSLSVQPAARLDCFLLKR